MLEAMLKVITRCYGHEPTTVDVSVKFAVSKIRDTMVVSITVLREAALDTTVVSFQAAFRRGSTLGQGDNPPQTLAFGLVGLSPPKICQNTP